MKKIIQAVKKSKSFLICMHVDPDGDTIGSASAFASLLDKLKKKYTLYSPNKIPDIYRFLKHTGDVKHEIEKNSRFDAVVALDCGDIDRIPIAKSLREHSDLIINIDHHADNTKFGDINFTRKSSSTGELVYFLIKDMGVKLDRDIATSIYAAIITDTGAFRYDNTTAGVFNIASELVKAGVDPHKTASNIYETRTRSEIRIMGKALERIETTDDGSIAWIKLSKKDIEETGACSEEMNGIVDQLRSLKGAQVAIFFRETENGAIKINFRSKGKNIQKIAEYFGGGGHNMASGAMLPGPLDDAVNRVIEKTKSLWTGL